MRLTWVVGAAVATIASPAVSQDARPFQFREFTEKTTMADAVEQGAIGSRFCRSFVAAGRQVTSCSLTDAWHSRGVSGYETGGGGATFDDQGLLQLTALVDARGFEGVRAAFAEKYGPSCRTSDAEFQNRLGARLPVTTITWCFSDGELQLSSLNPRNLKYGGINFTASRGLRARSDKPVVDF